MVKTGKNDESQKLLDSIKDKILEACDQLSKSEEKSIEITVDEDPSPKTPYVNFNSFVDSMTDIISQKNFRLGYTYEVDNRNVPVSRRHKFIVQR